MLRFLFIMSVTFSLTGVVFSQDLPPKKENPKIGLPKDAEDSIPKFYKVKLLEINAKDDELLKLKKERVNALTEIFQLELIRARIGTVNLFSLFGDYGREYLDARLELLPTLEDRLTLLKEYLDAAKEHHQQIVTRETAGFYSKGARLHYLAEIKWTELEILKLKRKTDENKKK